VDTPITRAQSAAVAATRPPGWIWISVVKDGEVIGVKMDAAGARAIARDLLIEADRLDPPAPKRN
jgi:uncharacterized protein YuzE